MDDLAHAGVRGLMRIRQGNLIRLASDAEHGHIYTMSDGTDWLLAERLEAIK